MMMKYFNLFFVVFFSCLLPSCAGNASANNPNTGEKDAGATPAGTGSGYYYEMTTHTQNTRTAVTMLLKMFLSPDGKVRTEMTTTGIPGKKENTPLVLIGAASNTSQSTIIDDAEKTYSIHHIDPNDLRPDNQLKSSAVKLGDEKIGGYNCVHARIIAIRNMGPLGNMVDTINVWKSHDVALPALFAKWMNEFETKTGGSIYSLETGKQLEQMGCTGFPVKLQVHGKSSTMMMELTKAERRDIPNSLFEIPAGYKEEKDGD